MSRETIVIYQKNCLDGFGAAFAIWKSQLPSKLKFIPMDYNERENWITSVRNNIEDRAQKDFIIVDFSFSQEDTEYLISISDSFTWLDHHKTAFDNWCGETYLKENSKYEYKDSISTILLDNEKSGAVLAWEHFHPYQPLPDALIFIQDRDLWTWHYPDTKAFTRSLSMLPQDFKVWEQILSPDCVEEMIIKGEAINEYYAEQLTRSIEATKERCEILGNVGLCCNLPPMFASEAGHVLAGESGTFGATWFKGKDGSVKWSLRGIGDYDVAAICKILRRWRTQECSRLCTFRILRINLPRSKVMAYNLEFFSDSRIALNHEVVEHPELCVLLANHQAQEFEIRLAEIANYCEVVLDDWYTPDDLDKLCDILWNKLREKRGGIIVATKLS